MKDLILITVVAAVLAAVAPNARACDGEPVYPETVEAPMIISSSIL